jgi:hypothetical protein
MFQEICADVQTGVTSPLCVYFIHQMQIVHKGDAGSWQQNYGAIKYVTFHILVTFTFVNGNLIKHDN